MKRNLFYFFSLTAVLQINAMQEPTMQEQNTTPKPTSLCISRTVSCTDLSSQIQQLKLQDKMAAATYKAVIERLRIGADYLQVPEKSKIAVKS